ncbi:ArsR/SmtB family transcription factor [Streptomyces sp. 4N509B]|uniref:ArsR/SmtB family transcription factor n=1 Tax=Streptomyces sp. 4N509B TaxID=3457413 RepID=UPI003FD27BC6
MDQVPPVDQETADFLKALASETRQRVMMLFAGGAELTVGEVAARSGLGVSTASEHLALLRRGGLLRAERDGRQVRYRADGSRTARRLDALKDYLTGCCPPD